MTHWIKQVLLRSAVGVVAGNARFRPRLYPLMGIDKTFGVLLMALGAELTARLPGQCGMVRAVGVMAGGAILCGRLVQSALPPILGHLAVTAETKGRLALALIAGMRRPVAAVAGHALHRSRGLMPDLVTAQLSRDVRMAVETDLPWLVLDQISLLGGVGAVAGEAVALCKGGMGALFRPFASQILMTGQTELSSVRRNLEQAGIFPAMGGMAARAFAAGEGTVLAEKPLFRHGLPMTGETER